MDLKCSIAISDSGPQDCAEFARPWNRCLPNLLSLNFSLPDNNFVLLGSAVTAISLIDQVYVANLFCLCLSFYCMTMVLYRLQ